MCGIAFTHSHELSVSKTSYVTSNGNDIIFLNGENHPTKVSLSDMSVNAFSPDVSAYNIVAFENTSEMYLYTKVNENYLWELVQF